MSPGRWALPSTACFRRSPMMPTTLTFALRAASACISPVTAAAPPMSPFMSSMPAAGLIELPPVSNTTPLPTKATGLSLALPPFHCMTTRRGGARRALRDAEQRAHAELLHLLLGQDLDLDAELLELLGAGGEFDRAEHIGRLVDEVARQHDAVGHRLGVGEGLLRRGRVGACGWSPWPAWHRPCRRPFVLLGLVFVEAIGAQQHARGELAASAAGQLALRQIEHDRHLGRLAQQAERWCRRASARRTRRGLATLPAPIATSRSRLVPSGAISFDRSAATCR